MVATEIKPFLEEAVSEVLEAMCFTSVEGPADAGVESVPGEWITGELSFIGQPSGDFGLAVLRETAAVIAANFLGDEEVVLSETQIAEVVCELTNMVCGALLSHLDPQKAFTLSPPRHGKADLLRPAAKERLSGTYRLDEGFIHAWVEVRERA